MGARWTQSVKQAFHNIAAPLRNLLSSHGGEPQAAEWLPRGLLGVMYGLTYARHWLRGNSEPTQIVTPELESTRRPVLLIHGFLGTQGCMFVLKQRLLADGYPVASTHLGLLNIRDIRASASMVSQQVERLLQEHPSAYIDIVAHSMGGIIALYYIKHLGGHERVRNLVLLGSPVRGTWLAWLGVLTLGWVAPSTWQLLPNSEFLAKLLDEPLPADVTYITFAGTKDRICAPATTLLPQAQQVTLPLGHSSLVVSKEAYHHIYHILSNSEDSEESGCNPNEPYCVKN